MALQSYFDVSPAFCTVDIKLVRITASLVFTQSKIQRLGVYLQYVINCPYRIAAVFINDKP